MDEQLTIRASINMDPHIQNLALFKSKVLDLITATERKVPSHDMIDLIADVKNVIYDKNE